MLKEFFRKVQFPIMLACGAAPVSAVLFALLAPEALYLAWLLPAAMVLLSMPCLLLRRKRMFIGLFIGLCYILGGSYLIRQLSSDPMLPAVPVLYSLLLLYTVPMGSWPWHQEPPNAVFIIGILLHIATQIAMSFLHFQEFYALEPIRTGMIFCFLIFMLTLLLSRNRSSLASAVRENPAIPRATQQKNLLMVLGFFLLLTLLSTSTLLADGIMAAFRGIVSFIVFLTSLRRETAEASTGESTTKPTELHYIPPTHMTDHPAQELLIATFRYLFPAIVFAFVVVVLILLFKYSSKLLRKLNLFLQRYTASATADYEDELTDTRDSPDPDEIPKPPVRLNFVQRRRLSPTEKIRYRYRQLQKRNPKWLASSTARENLPSDASPLYEQARYSDNPISSEDATEFILKTKRI